MVGENTNGENMDGENTNEKTQIGLTRQIQIG